MSGQSITFFLPTRKGSERVIDKNTRPFSTISGGILELKLRQLMDTRSIEKVVLSTNDEASMRIAGEIDPHEDKILVVPRPEELCLSSTPLVDLIKYVPSIVETEHIIWGHVTTPFVDGSDYDQGIGMYFKAIKDGYDSLVSVLPFQNFLLTKPEGKIYNYSGGGTKWPRTQDLEPLYEVNHAMFITKREVYINQSDRIGAKPFLFEMGKLKSIDIDWEEDFKIAEVIYEKFYQS